MNNNTIEISTSYTKYDVLYQQDKFAIIKARTTDIELIPKDARVSVARDNKSCSFIMKGYLNPNPLLKYIVTGYFKKDKRGVQFQVLSLKEISPTDKKGITEYLKKCVDGCGEITANKIYNTFGDKTFDVLDNTPERLIEVKGLSRNKIKKIVISYQNNKMIQILQSNLPNGNTNDCLRIYNKYKEKSLDIIKNNPYQLFDIKSFSFDKVDEIAKSNPNISLDDYERVQGAIIFVLRQEKTKGNLFLYQKKVISEAYNLLNKGYKNIVCNYTRIVEVFCNMAKNGHILGDNGNAYLPSIYEAETKSAEIVLSMLIASKKNNQHVTNEKVAQYINWYCKEYHFTPSEQQQQAVYMCVNNTFAILTGGAGTGKTTTLKLCLKTLQDIYNINSNEILMLAPTGRASRRMGESVGNEYETKTIHSALRIEVKDDISFDEYYQGLTAKDILETKKIIVVDEASMLGQKLFYTLMKSIPYNSRVLLVGDENQLPSVEAGNVLAELLKCYCVPVTKLTQIYRQSEISPIVENSHRILDGNTNLLFNEDFQLIEAHTQEQASNIIKQLYLNDRNIQILSPIRRKGEAGTDNLNVLIQSAVNPHSANTPEVKRNGMTFRVGDKVIQTQNVTIVDKNTGYEYTISNGDTGIIKKIYDEEITISFCEQTVTYSIVDMDNVSLAYAITIHKSQGSEYPVVVIPFIDDNLFSFVGQRHLIYTGITRGKEKVILVGTKKAINKAINTNKTNERKTILSQRILTGYEKIYPHNSGYEQQTLF